MPRSAPPPFSLATPLKDVPGIGPRTAERLADLGLTNVGKLIAHLPMRHEKLEAEAAIATLEPDRIVSARGEITATRVVGRGRAPRFEAVLIDDSGRLDLVWFNQGYLTRQLKPGMRLRVQGTTRRFGPGLQLANPTFEVLKAEHDEPDAREARIRPVYPATEAIPSKQIEHAVNVILGHAVTLLEDHLPAEFCKERNFPSLSQAYHLFHAPKLEGDVLAARRRLAFDELFFLQLTVHLKRRHLRDASRAPALRANAAIDRHIRDRFAFVLTPAQDRVVAEIAHDLAQETPANRLVQGDVGSGKTVVALYAMLLAVASRHQAALMAPTELLAEQHFASISRILEGSQVRLALFTGSVVGPERESLLAGLADGSIDLVVGTHALLTEAVRFKSLAVAVIDEQHRFGVHQRARLRAKGAVPVPQRVATPTPTPGMRSSESRDSEDLIPGVDFLDPPAPATSRTSNNTKELIPHVLVMTATPIPRSLAMTLFGDLDISTITDLPPGRKPVRTRVVAEKTRPTVYEFVRTRLDQGQQAYIVVPAIEDSPTAPDAAATPLLNVSSLLKELEAGPLAGLRLAALHGQLRRAEREEVMARLRAGQIDALVATTVIEVGVDVPNATLMIVEHADRFGLAQLHQLRGRVGRGEKESVCVLIADPTTDDAKQRLDVMAKTSDGFVLAEKDFEIRGFGELAGVKQSGLPPFKVADLARDRDLLLMAKRDAEAWIARSPTLDRPEEALLKRRLIKNYGEMMGVVDVG